MACRIHFPAAAAPVRFPAAYAETILRFCVASFAVTYSGVSAIAIAFPHIPAVVAQVCFAIFAPADAAYGGIHAIRFPKVAAVFRLGVAGVARADAGVGLISVRRPAPVMPRRVNPAAHGAGGRLGAGRYAEGTILRLGSVIEFAIALAGAGVGAVAVGRPIAIVVRPVFAEAFSTVAAFCFPYARGFLSNPVILQELFLAVIAPPQMLIFVLF